MGEQLDLLVGAQIDDDDAIVTGAGGQVMLAGVDAADGGGVGGVADQALEGEGLQACN